MQLGDGGTIDRAAHCRRALVGTGSFRRGVAGTMAESEEQALERDVIEIVIQVNGKTAINYKSAGASAESIEADVLVLDSVQKWIEGKTVRRHCGSRSVG